MKLALIQLLSFMTIVFVYPLVYAVTIGFVVTTAGNQNMPIAPHGLLFTLTICLFVPIGEHLIDPIIETWLELFREGRYTK